MLHYDVTGRPGKNGPEFSGDDYAAAARTKINGKAVDGSTVYKVNESNPDRVMRLTPQTDAKLPQPRTVDSRIVKDVKEQLAGEQAASAGRSVGSYSSVSQALTAAAWDQTYGTLGVKLSPN